MLEFFNSISGLAIFVGLASLAFSAWSHRSNRRVATIQGLLFDTGATGEQVMDAHFESYRYEPRVVARGPGIRHGARTTFWWRDGRLLESLWTQQKCAHFDVGSEPLTGSVDIPVGREDEFWFGVCWESVSGRGLRTDFVRINLGDNRIQRWHWYWHRAIPLHRWWGTQQRFRVLSGGKRRPMGVWRTVSTGAMQSWQEPI